MATPRPRGLTNLTEAAELASWSGTLRWAVPDPAAADDGGGPALEVRALDDAEAAAEGDRIPGPCGEVYVVASGQGALRCGGGGRRVHRRRRAARARGRRAPARAAGRPVQALAGLAGPPPSWCR